MTLKRGISVPAKPATQPATEKILWHLCAWLVYEQRMTEPHLPLMDAPWRAEVDALAARGRGFQQVTALKRHAEALQTSNPKLAAAAYLEAADVFINKLANQTEAAKCLASAAALSGGAEANESPPQPAKK
jgi:hypothetical protein